MGVCCITELQIVASWSLLWLLKSGGREKTRGLRVYQDKRTVMQINWMTISYPTVHYVTFTIKLDSACFVDEGLEKVLRNITQCSFCKIL